MKRLQESSLKIPPTLLQGLPEIEVKRGKPRFFTPGVKTPAYPAGVGGKNIGRVNYLAGVGVENISGVIYPAWSGSKNISGVFTPRGSGFNFLPGF